MLLFLAFLSHFVPEFFPCFCSRVRFKRVTVPTWRRGRQTRCRWRRRLTTLTSLPSQSLSNSCIYNNFLDVSPPAFTDRNILTATTTGLQFTPDDAFRCLRQACDRPSTRVRKTSANEHTTQDLAPTYIGKNRRGARIWAAPECVGTYQRPRWSRISRSESTQIVCRPVANQN